MMETTVQQLADEIGSPVDRLVEQFKEAGIQKKADDIVSPEEKERLLGHLKRLYGGASTKPAKMTLSRRKKRTLQVGEEDNKKDIQVEVRKKRPDGKKSESQVISGAGDLKAEESILQGTGDVLRKEQSAETTSKKESSPKQDDISETDNLVPNDLSSTLTQEQNVLSEESEKLASSFNEGIKIMQEAEELKLSEAPTSDSNDGETNKKTDSTATKTDFDNEQDNKALNWKRGESNLLSDKVETQDALGRKQLSDALVNFIDNDTYAGEMTIGLLGKWGSGKSTLIALLREQLVTSKSNQWLFAEFNAWEYEHADNIQAGVAQEAINGLKANLSFWGKLQLLNLFSKIERKWAYRAFWGLFLLLILLTIVFYINPSFFGIPWLGKAGLIATLGVVIAMLRNLSLLPFANTFNTYLKLSQFGKELGLIPVMKKHVSTLCRIILQGASSTRTPESWKKNSRADNVLNKIYQSLIKDKESEPWYKKWINSVRRNYLSYFLPENQRRLLYVVDDLDRCSPEGIIKVFEAVRLVMQQPHVTVLVAIDQDVALPALACHYEELSKHHNETTPTAIAREYLGKILQLPIVLNEPSSNDSKQFIQDVLFTNVFSLSEKSDENKGSGKSQASIEGSDEDAQSQKVVDEGINEGKNSQEVIGFSENEREQFVKLQQLFSFHNPRQLKRLFNGYCLLLFYSRENDQISNFQHQHIIPLLEWMTMIFTIESLYLSQLVCQIESQKFWDSWLDEGSEVQESFQSNHLNLQQVLNEFNDLADKSVDGHYLFNLYKKAKPFVLPALAKDDSEPKDETE